MVNRNKSRHTLAAAAAFLLLAGGVAFAAAQSQSITLPIAVNSMLVDAVLVPGAAGDSYTGTSTGWVDDEDHRVGFGEDGFCRINGGPGAAYNPSHLYHVNFDIRLVAGSWTVSVFVYDMDDNNALILSETGIDMGSDRPTGAEATGLVVANLSAN